MLRLHSLLAFVFCAAVFPGIISGYDLDVNDPGMLKLYHTTSDRSIPYELPTNPPPPLPESIKSITKLIATKIYNEFYPKGNQGVDIGLFAPPPDGYYWWEAGAVWGVSTRLLLFLLLIHLRRYIPNTPFPRPWSTTGITRATRRT